MKIGESERPLFPHSKPRLWRADMPSPLTLTLLVIFYRSRDPDQHIVGMSNELQSTVILVGLFFAAAVRPNVNIRFGVGGIATPACHASRYTPHHLRTCSSIFFKRMQSEDSNPRFREIFNRRLIHTRSKRGKKNTSHPASRFFDRLVERTKFLFFIPPYPPPP